MTVPDGNQAIERFVRGTLGCGCPDEVFDSIEIERTAGPGESAPCVRLLVGGRLLIYVLEAQDLERIADAVSELARHGIEQRDRAGLNRFRLVVAADDPTQPLKAATGSFASRAGTDDRAHLHVIATDLLPASLR